VGCNSHVAEVTKIVESCVALVYDDGALPISQRLRVASFSAVQCDLLDGVIRAELERSMPPGQVISHEKIVSGEMLPLGKSRGADVSLVFTKDISKDAGMLDQVNRVLGLGRQSVVIAVNSPYDLRIIRKPSAYIATYSPDPTSVHVAVEALSGKVTLVGAAVPNLEVPS